MEAHWAHRTSHSIRLSGNEKFVLSGGFDKKAILASSEDGAILATYDFPSVITGILWCFGTQKALVSSFDKLVLLKMGSDNKSLAKLAEAKKKILGMDSIYGMNSSFGSKVSAG